MTLADSRFPDRASLQAHQLAGLGELLSALLPDNSFYSQKLAAAGLNASLATLDEFVARAPFTLKQELVDDQLRNPPYGSNLTFPLERYTRFNQTSGTAGKPMLWLDTTESWSWMLDNWDHVYRAAGVTAGDCIFFAFSFGPFLGFWTAFEAATRMGCLCVPGGGMRSGARLRTMIDTGATVLCCTPTYAIRLAEVAAEEAIDLTAAKVKTIIVAGEPGAGIPATRAHIEKLWHGARLFDHHGMTETGPVSYECPNRRGVLHVIESAYIGEVVDPQNGKAVGAGGTGELVLTNLGRMGSPLLRYRTGDLVRRANDARCECGSYNLALEGGILGRTDDMVVVRGVNIYPSAVEEILRGCDGVAEYRVEVRSERALPELKIEVEPVVGHPDTASLEQRVQSSLSNAFALRVAVCIVPAGELPRFEMKAKRWVRV
ncbi:MAG: AMP-binding protein [Bryobacterales bacterium]